MENKEKDFKLANVIDKFEIARKKNKIQNTCFFNEQEILQVEKEIRMYNNYFFFGGYEEAARKILIVYPEKFTKEIELTISFVYPIVFNNYFFSGTATGVAE